MPIKNQTAKTVQLLRQSSTKMQGFFNVTHFNRIVSKEVSSALQSGKKLGKTPESIIKCEIVAQIKQPRSQRDFTLWLQDSSIWTKICCFKSGSPTQGTFSNNWNNIDYFQPLENIFLTYQKLIPKKGLFTQFELPYHLLKTIKSSYFPIITDSSYIYIFQTRDSSMGQEDTNHQIDQQSLELDYTIDMICVMCGKIEDAEEISLEEVLKELNSLKAWELVRQTIGVQGICDNH